VDSYDLVTGPRTDVNTLRYMLKEAQYSRDFEALGQEDLASYAEESRVFFTQRIAELEKENFELRLGLLKALSMPYGPDLSTEDLLSAVAGPPLLPDHDSSVVAESSGGPVCVKRRPWLGVDSYSEALTTFHHKSPVPAKSEDISHQLGRYASELAHLQSVICAYEEMCLEKGESVACSEQILDQEAAALVSYSSAKLSPSHRRGSTRIWLKKKARARRMEARMSQTLNPWPSLNQPSCTAAEAELPKAPPRSGDLFPSRRSYQCNALIRRQEKRRLTWNS